MALVGRARERDALAAALDTLPGRRGAVVAIDGEPGIGKSRLLADLAERASAAGCTVLGARASEYETDLPYAIWTEALDRHLAAAGERRVTLLGLADADALTDILPALAGAPARGDRHRTFRALRDLLERLAAARPLVLWLDDVHWADPASVDALAALVHRPPVAPVLVAIAAREGQLPRALSTALAGAAREERVTPLHLAPLSEAEASELVGDRAPEIYRQAGGNPFYLEQLARVASDDNVPATVLGALEAELATVSPDARRLLDAAAVAGDPFEPRLTAAIAELAEPAALTALDELLARTLVRPAAAPRQFSFRHPVVRHAVYVGAPQGWRLGAHARAADELERARRRPGSARPSRRARRPYRRRARDRAARAGGRGADGTRPGNRRPLLRGRVAAAAPRAGPAPRRLGRVLADAQAAAGDAPAARASLIAALDDAQDDERLTLIVAIANQDWWISGHEEAQRRLSGAGPPRTSGPDRVRLRQALSLMALMGCDLDAARAHAADTLADARELGEVTFAVGALAVDALALASAADDAPAARRRLEESGAALERLSPRQLATRLPALWMHGRAHRALGEHAAALADLERGAELARQTGRERILLMVAAESVAVLIELGRIADAIVAGEESLERARLAGNPRILLWAQSGLSSACLAAGDVASALRHAGEAEELGIEPDFHAPGQPGWCLGAALTAAGNAERAVPLMLKAFGGPGLTRVLPADRPAAAADLVETLLGSWRSRERGRRGSRGRGAHDFAGRPVHGRSGAARKGPGVGRGG